MKSIIDKLSTYNFFNYLLPGILFVVIIDFSTAYLFTQDNVIIGFFVYYFIGLTISRLGSLIIEPILKKLSFLEFSGYKNFVLASEKDSMIKLFSEVNNMYRTFCSLFTLIVIFNLYFLIDQKFDWLNKYNLYILLFFLLIIYYFSYRKQTQYIAKRINIASQKDNNAK